MSKPISIHPTAEKREIAVGLGLSLICHIAGIIAFAIAMERGALIDPRQEVFSVTLEGGEKLGGFTQVPKDDKKHIAPAASDQLPSESPEARQASEPEQKEAVIDKPSAVEEQKKLLEQKKAEELKKLEEQKKLDELKKKEEEKKKAEDKKKADEKKKQEIAAQEKELEDKKKKQRDKLLEKALKNAKIRYEGESADAGGEGIGAAKLGGKGFGGGTLADPEFIAYMKLLDQLVHEKWSWLPGSDRLQATVEVYLQPDGQMTSVRIAKASGNSAFDDSVMRAVYGANPVPPPPQKFYDTKFRVVTFSFDSHQQ